MQTTIQRSGSLDQGWTAEIKHKGRLMASGVAAPVHGGEVAEGEASAGSMGSEVAGVGQDW
jgi:hypothetical protein